MELLEELGYCFNAAELRKKFEKAGIELWPGIYDWYETAAPYIVMAYDAGRNGENLSDVFPFLEVAG